MEPIIAWLTAAWWRPVLAGALGAWLLGALFVWWRGRRKSGLFTELERYSSFRRIALAQWGPPSDGSIYGSMYLDVTESIELLARLKEKHGATVSPAALVGKAASIALHAAPDLNGRVIGRKIFLKSQIDVYYQVDVGQGSDLAGCVVQHADKKTLHEISFELSAKAKKIRAGKDKQYEKAQKRGLIGRSPVWLLALILRLFSWLLFKLGIPSHWLGASEPDPFGSVMVTNMGSFGIDVAYAPLVPWTRTPIVILVGAVRDMPLVVDGEIKVRKVLPCSATFDHRMMDGAHVATFVNVCRRFVENANEEGTVEWNGKTYGHRLEVTEGTAAKPEGDEAPAA